MRSPVLNRKLVLETVEQVSDGAGGYVETWQPLGTLWAHVTAGSGRETETAGLSVSSVPCKILVRAAPEGAPSRPKAGQRFLEGSRIYRIHAVAEADHSARHLVCSAREEVVT